MSVKTITEPVTEHTCDRCGRQARCAGSSLYGWGPSFTLFVQLRADVSQQPYLCPGCRDSFRLWLEFRPKGDEVESGLSDG